MQKIVFIGAGSMAEAMISGWIAKECLPSDHIYVTNRSDYERLQYLQRTYGVQILEQLSHITSADCIILAMKPKDAVVAMASIAPYIGDKTAVLSVLAGIPINLIENKLYPRAIARIMPNTSATIGMSATGIAFNSRVDASLKQQFIQLMQAIGLIVEVAEDQLHAVTALSGSGPAYMYYLLEAFEQAGADLGLSKETVRELMIQTIAGSAAMLQTTGEEPAELRRKVTSPNGTTEAGIHTLQQRKFNETIAACIKSAEQRSRDLADGI